jgi:hypothetical protein
MKVTKLIREYVEKSVAKAMPDKKEETDEIQVEYDEMTKDINEYAKKRMTEFLEKHKGNVIGYYASYNYDETEKTAKYLIREVHTHTPSIRTKLSDEICEENKKLAEARGVAVNDILVNLELGGTKADLDRMIAELGKGE